MSISTDRGEYASREVDRFATVACFAGELHVLLRVDECGKAAADGGLVVGDEYADHALLSW